MANAVPSRVPNSTLLKVSEAKKKKASLLSILGPKGGVYDDTSRGNMPMSARHHGARTLKDAHGDMLEKGADSPVQGDRGYFTDPRATQDFPDKPNSKPSKLRQELTNRGSGRTAEMPGTPDGHLQLKNGDKVPMGKMNPQLKIRKSPGYINELLDRIYRLGVR